MTDGKKESNIIKLFKMVYDALFSPSPRDELYKPSELILRMAIVYIITIIVVLLVLYLVLKWIGFDLRNALNSLGI